MKKLFTLLAACLGMVSAQAQGNYVVKTLTFEDKDYVSEAQNYLGKKDWSSLIDNTQYGGDLLYGENHGDPKADYSTVNYKWYDEGNTYLYSELPENWGSKMYWGGGHAVSNYWDGNLNNGDYNHQLSVYVPNTTSNGRGGHGHNGSDNFCVHYGYRDNSGYSADNLPFFKFGNGGEYTIEGMWINNTTYFVNGVTNGNGLTNALGDKDYVMIEATGYDKNNTVTGTARQRLAFGKNFCIKDWTYWNMKSLKTPNRVEFNIVGTSNNGYGFSQPTYFCYDDVQVRISTENSSAKVKTQAAENTEKTFEFFCNQYSGAWWTGDVPEGHSYEWESIGEVEGKQLGLIAPGEEVWLTIKGMTPDMEITKILPSSDINMEGALTITAYIGDRKIGEKSYRQFLADEKYDFDEIIQSTADIEFPFVENVDTRCDGDLKFHYVAFDDITYFGSVIISYKTGASSGIEEIKTETVSDAIYNLQGIRVTNPVKGQVYIRNGKKFIKN